MPNAPQRNFVRQQPSYEDEPVYLLAQNKLWRTRNFKDASPAWVDITGSLAGMSLNDLYLDQTDPYNQAWLASTSGIWYTGNLDAATPAWVQKATFNAVKVFRHPSGKMMATGGSTLRHADSDGNNWQVGDPG